MGIIRMIKEAIAFRKMMKDTVKEWNEKQSAYCDMTSEALAALPDQELYGAALVRMETIAQQFDGVAESFEALNNCRKVLYALNYLEMEVNNGGLCQFFINSSRVLAPYISDYLDIVGAKEHKELFDGFIDRYGIDLSDLSSFRISRIRDYEKQAQRYPFDEYDDAFYQLPALDEQLTAYIRANVTEF